MGTEAERLREQAAEMRAEARESFERCDTDGFLSQWANGINARLAERKAQLAENGGMAMFARWALIDIDGEEITDARRISTRFGDRWRIDRTDEWIAYGSARAAKRRGYRVIEQIEQAKAFAIIAGSGRGLSGAASCFIATYRDGAKKADGWRCIGIREDEREEEYRGAAE